MPNGNTRALLCLGAGLLFARSGQAAELDAGLAANSAADAAAGNAYFSPTAITPRGGTLTVSGWMPALPFMGLATARYAVTDRLELSAGAAWVGVAPDSATYVAAKLQAFRGESGAVAVEAQHASSVTLTSAVGTVCLGGPTCPSTASAHLVTIWGNPEIRPAQLAAGFSVIAGGEGRAFKVVVDAGFVQVSRGADVSELVFGYVGARYARRVLAADLGLVAAVSGDVSAIVPVPLLSLSLRAR